jgi:hypothetical protein
MIIGSLVLPDPQIFTLEFCCKTMPEPKKSGRVRLANDEIENNKIADSSLNFILGSIGFQKFKIS